MNETQLKLCTWTLPKHVLTDIALTWIVYRKKTPPHADLAPCARELLEGALQPDFHKCKPNSVSLVSTALRH